MQLELVEGWTGDIDQQLKADGVAVNLTGITVTLILTAADGTVVNTDGKVQKFEEAAGKVRFNPAANDLKAAKSPYRAHWKAVDGANEIVFFPSGIGDTWNVHPQ